LVCLFLFNGGVVLIIVVDGTSLQGLERLPSHSDSKGHYFGDSRQREIKDTLHWIEEAGSKHFLWIHGAAGVGKSTLARELLDRFKVEGILATFASFVMGIDSKPKVLVRMMARELSSLHPGCRPAIACALLECSGEIRSLIEYITHYLVKPIASLAYAGPLVIILDALDEWVDGAEFLGVEFLEGLFKVDLPANLKVIMTSRYSKDIESVVDGAARLYELTPVSNIVCRAYFEDKFRQINWEGREPEPFKFSKLVRLADGLLMWAATVCTLLSFASSKKSPNQILDDIIGSSQGLGRTEKMEKLYRMALERLFPDDDGRGEKPQRLQTILSMVTLRESLPLQDFARLVAMRPEFVKATCSGLRALQSRGAFNDSTVQPAIKLFHASFIDYLGHDQARNAMVNNCIHFFTHVAEPNAAELNPFPFQKAQLYVYMGKHWAGHMEEGRSEEYSTAFFEVTSDQLRLWVAWSLSRLLFLEDNSQPSSSMLQTLSTALCSAQGMRYSPGIFLSDRSTVVADFRQALDYGKIDYYNPDFYIQKQDCRSTSTNIFIGCHTKWLSIDARRWALVINGLAIGLQQIQRATSDLTGLDAVINILENLITVDSPDLPEHPAFLDNLGVALHSRFESSCSRHDLEGAILLHTKALGAHAQDSLNYAISLGNLGRALHSRFHHFGSNPKDIEQAIVHHRQALQLLQPSDDPLRPSSLYALGNSLIHAHSLARERSDYLEEAMSLFCAATQFFAQPYVLRFYVARKSSLIKVFQTVARHMQHPGFDFRGVQLVALDQGPHIQVDLEEGRVFFKILDPLLRRHGIQSSYNTKTEVDDGYIDIIDLVILVAAYFRSLQVDDIQISSAGFLRFLDL
jgi:hypothetical protein